MGETGVSAVDDNRDALADYARGFDRGLAEGIANGLILGVCLAGVVALAGWLVARVLVDWL